jgi:prepilin-type N-terminal cleavage/methylation domain-containing protein
MNTRNPGQRRSGFTLVELLVVITIIIILMGLLTPVVMIALGRAKEGRITLEIATLDGAMKAYKEKRGSYPPSDFVNIGTATYSTTAGFTYTGPSTASHPQLDALATHLAKAFPRCNIQTELAAIIVSNPNYPGKVPAPVSPSQAIYFWLSGFSTDVEHPISALITNSTGPREAPFFEFDKTRLSYTNLPATAAPNYCASDTRGIPYVYFASQNYFTHASSIYSGPGDFNKPGSKTGGFPMTPYDTALWQQGGTGLVRPYAADPYSAASVPTFAMPNSFQIISAGLDGDFGKGGVDDAGGHDANIIVAYFKQGNFYATGDKDNLTNFSDRTLGDAIPK